MTLADLMAPFLLHAIVAGLSVALLTAPLGCLIVWRRMAYVGETIAQAGLLGIALGLFLRLDLTLATLTVTILMAVLLDRLGRQTSIPVDSLLGLLAHGALAAGVVATVLVRGGSVDLMGYLFGDIFAVSRTDLAWVVGVGAAVLGALVWLWGPLLRIAIHDELAAAEGVARERVNLAFVVLLAVAVAIAMKVVGVLLAISFLIMPAVAARQFATTPEGMAVGAAAIGASGVAAGLALSMSFDVPGGAAIVLVLAFAAIASVAVAPLRVGR